MLWNSFPDRTDGRSRHQSEELVLDADQVVTLSNWILPRCSRHRAGLVIGLYVCGPHESWDCRGLLVASARPSRAAVTLASMVLPGDTIDIALKEATMPVPVRDTPLGRELYEQGRQEGQLEGRQEGERQAVLRLTRLMLRRRFGDDFRVEAIAAQLAALPDEERLTRLTSATSLEDLQR